MSGHPFVITIGEAMAVLLPGDDDTYRSAIGGAEFNVAASLARMGVPTGWVSRLGTDALGDRVLREAAQFSIDTSGVQRDPARPTGLYIKETVVDDAGPRSTMRYYRAGSAASAMDSAFFDAPEVTTALARASVVHVSGITPALSAPTANAMAGLRGRLRDSTILSVDLNLRPALWGDRDREPLTALARQADVLFVGADEARAHFGHDDGPRLLSELPEVGMLIVKDDSRAAASFSRASAGVETSVVPALKVEVRETIGAGDAFAAGYLTAMLDGADEVGRLRTAHALASLALVSPTDRPDSVPDSRERALIATTTDWDSWAVTGTDLPWATRVR